jgi:outer membrane protein
MTGKWCPIFIMIFFVTASLSRGGEASSLTEMKIGWVDLDKVFHGYYKTEEVLKKLEEDLKSKEGQIEKMAEEIITLKKEMELLSESGRLQKEKEIVEKRTALRDLKAEAEIDLNKKIFSEKEKLLEEIIEKIEEKGKAEGYTYIFRGELLLYSEGALDLTDDIIAELNKGEEK